MRSKSHSSLSNRAVACLGVVCFLGLALWVGLCVPEEPRTPLQISESKQNSSARTGGRPGQLTISAGPLVRREDGNWFIHWRTSAPSDSLVTYGRRDPFDHILAKEQRLVREHLHRLPDVPFAEFHRYRIMSVSAHRNVVTATCGPGDGPDGALFAESGWGRGRVPPPSGDGSRVAWADLDGDGDLDLAVARAVERGTQIRLLRWEKGRFTGGAARAPVVPGTVERLIWGDFNADGHLDLLASGSTPRIYLNSGPPLWTVEVAKGAFSRISEVSSLRVLRLADLNSDGLPDLLAATAEGRVRILLNSGGAHPRLREAEGSPLPALAGGSVRALCSADFTGDGRPDVLAMGRQAVLWQRVDEGFQPVPDAVSGLPESAENIAGAVVADYNSDGAPDVYVPVAAEGGGVLLENRGSGRLVRAAKTGELAKFASPVTAAAWADLTGNSHPDLVLGRAGGGIGVLLNDGSGDFLDASAICGFAGEAGEEIEHIMLASFSGDSAPDMHLRFKGGEIRLLKNFARGAEKGDFLRVCPFGPLGLIGAEVRLMDVHGSTILATALIESGPGPAECVFGVRDIHEAVVQVRYSDGVSVSRRWSREDSPRLLRIGRSR